MDNQRIIRLRTMPYEEYLKTPEWAKKREQALERDGYRCRNCNSSEHLHVHHRTYARRGHEDLNDLTTLCRECHEHFHNRMRFTDFMDEGKRTSNPPREPRSRDGILAREEANRQKWEEYLIGLLLRNGGLLPYIIGIIDEDDFSGAGTKALYQLIKATPHSGQSIELSVPSDLMPVISRATELVDNESNVESEIYVKVIVEAAVRMKRDRLVRLNREIQFLIREATQAGDLENRQVLQQRLLEIHRQLHTFDSASHLQG